jgi:hypothetical protein
MQYTFPNVHNDCFGHTDANQHQLFTFERVCSQREIKLAFKISEQNLFMFNMKKNSKYSKRCHENHYNNVKCLNCDCQLIIFLTVVRSVVMQNVTMLTVMAPLTIGAEFFNVCQWSQCRRFWSFFNREYYITSRTNHVFCFYRNKNIYKLVLCSRNNMK